MECKLVLVLCCLTFLLMLIHQSFAKTRRRYGEGDIRLVGGGKRWRGTVLILKRGKWGAICDEMWGLNDATVACRQLGYKGAIQAPIRSKYGPGRKRKWMTQFRCRGTEENLSKCISGRRRYGDRCTGLGHSAGVVCTRNPVTLESIWKRYGIRFAPQKPKTTTRTTTKSTTTTTTTPTTTTTTTTTTPTTTTTTTTATTTTTPETTTKHVMSDLEEEIAAWASHHPQNETEEKDEEGEKENGEDITDQETKANLERPKNDAASINLGNEGIFVISPHSNSSSSPIMKKKHLKKYVDKNVLKMNSDKDSLVLADKPPDTKLDIRLKGGRYPFEGRLEVRFGRGDWGVICADEWSLKEVMVACRQIGGIGKAKQPLKYSYFGGSKMQKIVHKIECIGREKSMSECKITRANEGDKCSVYTSVAGVVCSDNLPDLVPSLRALEASARLQDQPLFYLRCSMEENCLSSSAYVIRNTSLVWRNNIRRLFRFSTVVHNSGIADFKPYRAKDQWEWHACHMHYHSMEIFAHYDIVDAQGYRLAEGSKASFCLEDTVCDKGTKPKYNCRGLADQGLSVNCSDNYMYDIDCQWIDITDMKPGDYTFLLEVNPFLLVAESDFGNNVVQCDMHYNGYFASLRNCEHQSLLDYRRAKKLPS